MPYRLHGEAAQICWEYFWAATLGSWTIEHQTLTATITQADRYRLTQGPLAFVPRTGRRWVLRDVTVGPTDLRATLGPPPAQGD